MQKYKNRIRIETEYIGANVSCISTEKGLVLIDSPFLPRDARAWRQKLQAETGQEIAYVINTDHHFDHVMGNEFLSPNIICHDTAARGLEFTRNKDFLRRLIKNIFPDQMAELEPEIDDLVVPPPLFSFDQSLTLDMGDVTLVLEFMGGHSPGTIMIYCPEEKALFTGDNVEGQFPAFVEAHMTSWNTALKKMLAMEIDLVAPGHGLVGGKEMIEVYVSFFQNLEAEIRSFAADGLEIDQMAEQSEVIYTFPMEPAAEPWIKGEYKAAAKAVLTP